MKGSSTLKLGSIALLTALAVLAVGTGAAASTGDVTLTDPANETVTVDADFTGSADVTLSLSQDGTEVQSETISGASGDSTTASMSMQGLATGDYNLSVTATNESVVTLSEPTMHTTRTQVLNVTQNETVAVDVLFDTDTTTSATVNIFDSTGSVLNASTLTYDPVETSGTTGTETVEWDATTDGQLDVTVTTNAYAYDGIAVTQDSGSEGIAAGLIGESADIPPWASAIGGIATMAFVALLIVRLN